MSITFTTDTTRIHSRPCSTTVTQRSWLILPYCPTWYDARVSRAFRSVPVPCTIAELGKPTVSWRLRDQHLVQVLRNLHKRKYAVDVSLG